MLIASVSKGMFLKKVMLSDMRRWKMRNSILIACVVGIIIAFIVGLLLGLFLPRDNGLITGDRPHLIGNWTGLNGNPTYTFQFFENGSCISSSYLGNFIVTQDQLIVNYHGTSMTAQFFFINDYNTLGLMNINSNSADGNLEGPYGLIFQRV